MASDGDAIDKQYCYSGGLVNPLALNHRVEGSIPSQPAGFTCELKCLKVSGLLT